MPFSYSDGKDCNPLTSTVTANSPFHTDNEAIVSAFVSVMLCLVTKDRRSITEDDWSRWAQAQMHKATIANIGSILFFMVLSMIQVDQNVFT